MVKERNFKENELLSGKLLKNGQVTIPNIIRKKYDVKQCDIVFFSITKIVKKNGSIIEGPISDIENDSKQKKLNNIIVSEEIS